MGGGRGGPASSCPNHPSPAEWPLGQSWVPSLTGEAGPAAWGLVPRLIGVVLSQPLQSSQPARGQVLASRGPFLL